MYNLAFPYPRAGGEHIGAVYGADGTSAYSSDAQDMTSLAEVPISYDYFSSSNVVCRRLLVLIVMDTDEIGPVPAA
jgi:hypothetical protein